MRLVDVRGCGIFRNMRRIMTSMYTVSNDASVEKALSLWNCKQLIGTEAIERQARVLSTFL